MRPLYPGANMQHTMAVPWQGHGSAMEMPRHQQVNPELVVEEAEEEETEEDEQERRQSSLLSARISPVVCTPLPLAATMSTFPCLN